MLIQVIAVPVESSMSSWLMRDSLLRVWFHELASLLDQPGKMPAGRNARVLIRFRDIYAHQNGAKVC